MHLGRPRQFCSATCRSAARRARSRSDDTGCEIEFASIRCGKPAASTINLGDRQLGICGNCAEFLRPWLLQRGAQPTITGRKTSSIASSEPTHEVVRTGDGAAATADVVMTGVMPVTPARLSSREREVVALVAQGHIERVVARELGLKVTTVQQYLARARLKYDAVDRPAPTRIDLYRRAVEDGLLPPEETKPPVYAVTSERTDEDPFGAKMIGKAVAGDPSAIDALLRAIKPLVVRYCNARVGRSSTTADDVAQEVCLTVLTSLPNYQAQGRPFLAFVYGIAAHKVADAHRALARNRAEPMAEVPDQAVRGAGPEEFVLQDELNGSLGQLLHLLPEKQREILVLRVVVGLSAEETAEAVGSTPGAVRIAQHRALAKLRHSIIEQGPE